MVRDLSIAACICARMTSSRMMSPDERVVLDESEHGNTFLVGGIAIFQWILLGNCVVSPPTSFAILGEA